MSESTAYYAACITMAIVALIALWGVVAVTRATIQGRREFQDRYKPGTPPPGEPQRPAQAPQTCGHGYHADCNCQPKGGAE